MTQNACNPEDRLLPWEKMFHDNKHSQEDPMTRLFTLAAAAVILLSACGDSGKSLLEPAGPSFASGDPWNLFTNQVPNETLDAAPGLEVATQFYLTKPACVAYLRFWRAV